MCGKSRPARSAYGKPGISAAVIRQKTVLELIGDLAGAAELLDKCVVRFLGTFAELMRPLEMARQFVFERPGLHDQFLRPTSTISRHLSAPQ